MKKIILVIFLSFFISSISYSKTISFNNCYILGDETNYNSKINHKKNLEKNTYEVDILNKTIKNITIFRDDYLKDKPGKSKITTYTWNVEYIDNNYINGFNYAKIEEKRQKIVILIKIKEKTIDIKAGENISVKYQCE